VKKKILLALITLLGSTSLFAASQCVPISSWVDTKSKKIVTPSAVIKEAVDKKVMLLGEDHDNEEHHRWQLSMISQAYALNPKMAIGFEMFPRAVQPILDDWVAGELTEREFLERTDWNKVWSYNPAYYMPMFHFARMHRIPMYALNIPREIVSEIAEKGWDALSSKTREHIGKPAPATTAYRDMMTEIFIQHQPHGSDISMDNIVNAEPGVSYFIQGQLAWDRAMAGAIVDAMKRDDVELFVGVMGAGHIIPKMSVPYQLADLGIKESISLMPWDDTMPCEEFDNEMANFVFGVDKQDPHGNHGIKNKARLGVYLEAAELGIQISRVVEDSIAEKAGLKKDDIIIEIAGKPAKHVTDVVLAVRSMPPGAWLPIKVLRVKKKIQMVAKFPPN
jgi:uncharacterized iron-regulated protein